MTPLGAVHVLTGVFLRSLSEVLRCLHRQVIRDAGRGIGPFLYALRGQTLPFCPTVESSSRRIGYQIAKASPELSTNSTRSARRPRAVAMTEYFFRYRPIKAVHDEFQSMSG